MSDETLFDMTEFLDPKTRKPPETEAEKERKRRVEVQRRELRNLERKIERGLTLTGPEQRRRQELEAALSIDGDPPMPDGVVKSAKEVGEFFGRTLRTVRYWVVKGMPRRSDGYDLAAIGQWALGLGLIQELPAGLRSAEVSQPGAQPQGQPQAAPDQVPLIGSDRARYETEIKRIDAEHKALKLSIARGDYVPRADLAREWGARMSEVTNGLDFLEMRLPPILEGKTQMEMRSIIREEIWKIKDRYYRTGRFCPPLDSSGGLEPGATMAEGAA